MKRSRKPASQAREEAKVRLAVFERDGYRCQLRDVPDAGQCWGWPTFHHRRKSGQGGEYTVENGATLCVHHNGQLEADADLAAIGVRLGLVLRRWSA